MAVGGVEVLCQGSWTGCLRSALGDVSVTLEVTLAVFASVRVSSCCIASGFCKGWVLRRFVRVSSRQFSKGSRFPS